MVRTANRKINNTKSCYLVALVVIASLALASGARHLTQTTAFASSSSTNGQTITSAFTTEGGSASATSSIGNSFSGSVSQDGQGFSIVSDGTATVTSDGTRTPTVSIPSSETSDDTSTVTVEAANPVTSEAASTVTDEDSSTVIGEGSATASATATGGATPSVATTVKSSPFIITAPLEAFISTPKGTTEETTIDEDVVKAVSAVAETSRRPSCENKGDYKYCCNYAHEYSDVCKCNFVPLNGNIFKRFWRCEAVRVPDTTGPAVWLDLRTGDECQCA